MSEKKYVPVWEYCKQKGISRQNLYRWIREGKVPADQMRKSEKVVTRIEIDQDWK